MDLNQINKLTELKYLVIYDYADIMDLKILSKHKRPESIICQNCTNLINKEKLKEKNINVVERDGIKKRKNIFIFNLMKIKEQIKLLKNHHLVLPKI